MKRARDAERPWWKKLGWFALLWAGGVTTLGAAAYAIRFLMHAAGLSA
ncbi:DUF2474 domain-containing protein [Herbaspirillum sp. HC18]|nr:DUF2474 domain-containing protein [Herbaspirillum sp. HC18]